MKQVALLRGINVGKSVRIGMADLRELFTSLGCESVQTILQSGNVVFEGAVTRAQLEDAIVERFSYSSRVFVRSAAEFRAVAADNPFRGIADDPSRMVITFLDDLPAGFSAPDVDPPERIALTHRALYQWCPEGILTSQVPPAFWRTLGSRATSRNLRTVDKLLALLDA